MKAVAVPLDVGTWCPIRKRPASAAIRIARPTPSGDLFFFQTPSRHRSQRLRLIVNRDSAAESQFDDPHPPMLSSSISILPTVIAHLNERLAAPGMAE